MMKGSKAKRSLGFALSGILLCGAALSGCSDNPAQTGQQGDSPNKTVIEFWHGHTGPDGKVMDELVKNFMQSHPEIEIKIQSMPWDDLFTKAQLAIRTNSGPDLVTMPLDRMVGYKDAMFKPVDDLIKDQLNPADFDPNLWSKTMFDGKQYGIPLDTHPYVLYYRPDLVQKAGLDPLPKDRPLTREEFETYAKALTSDTVKGFAFKQTAVQTYWDFWNVFLQNGGALYNKEQTKSEFKSGAAKNALQYLVGLRDEQKVAPPEVLDWKTAYSRFTDGSVAILLHGSWLIPGLEAANTPYETAMVPHFGAGDYAAFANMHAFAFTRTDETRTKAAFEFVKWVESDENASKWGTGSGNVPVNLKARETYAQNPKFQPLAKTAETMKGNLFMYPYNKNGETLVYKYIIPSLEGVYNKSFSIDTAIETIDKSINELLKP